MMFSYWRKPHRNTQYHIYQLTADLRSSLVTAVSAAGPTKARTVTLHQSATSRPPLSLVFRIHFTEGTILIELSVRNNLLQ